MTVWQKAQRQYSHWRQYPKDHLRWLTDFRRTPLKTATFRLGGTEYPYYLHPYNHTWSNERVVEISVVRPILSSVHPTAVLEVGNVMSHYFDCGHTVIDKWERCRYRPVTNSDLLEFHPPRQFELVVSISTIEHVGWDESPRKETSVIAALHSLRSLLTPTGKAVITIPVGYNHYLDRMLPTLVGDLLSVQCLKRLSCENQWSEVDLDAALRCKYGEPFPNANAVVFATIPSGSEGAPTPQSSSTGGMGPNHRG